MPRAAQNPDIDWERDAVLLGRDDVSDFNEENILPQSPDTIAKIRKWLRPTAYDDGGSEYKKHLSAHLQGTGNWLLASSVYKDWHSSQDIGILWIRGTPGSGKSVIAATLADHLAQEQVPVLYFFFRQIIDANHSPGGALHDWLCQILNFSPPLQIRLLDYVTKRRSLESVSSEDLWNDLRAAIVYLPKVYCVVDALDEIDQGPEMVDFLHSLANFGAHRPAQVKLIMTSRPVHSVEMHLRQAKILNIRLAENMVDMDIATYVQHQLASSLIPKNHHQAIKDAVPGRANGLFLYARLAMDAFLEPGVDPQKVLNELPADLNVMYTDLLREHARRTGVPHDVQLLIMQWVTHATRPLRLLELAESINITHYGEGERNLKAAKELARSSCGPLVEILPDETISVVHHSLTEFLNGSTRQTTEHDYPILEFGPTNNHLALVCLAHLRSGCLKDVEAKFKTPGRILWPWEESRQLLPPFSEYAAKNWYIHARKAELAGEDQSEVIVALDEFFYGESFLTWAALAEVGCVNVTPLFAAVSLGLTQYTKELLSRDGTSPNKGDMREPPLYRASRSGYDKIVKLLLRYGVDTMEWNEHGYRALHAAATHNHPSVITLLLEAGVDPFCQVASTGRSYDHGLEPGGTPVSKACSSGHVEALEALLPYIDTAEAIHGALKVAVSSRRAAVVERLLKHPKAEVDGRKGVGNQRTHLYMACTHRNLKIIKLLLESGADPNIVYNSPLYPGTEETANRGFTALMALSSAGDVGNGGCWGSYHTVHTEPEESIDAFKLMLKAGANVRQVDCKGNTVLHHATDKIALRLLLDAGADVNAVNDDGETLLHGYRDPDMLRLVFEEGNVNTSLKKRYEGHTPLLSSLSKGDASKALLLLEHGADSNGIDRNGNGAFHLAVAMDFKDMPRNQGKGKRLIQALRGSGADVNLRNKKGFTPLHSIEYRKFADEIFIALCDAGLDVEARDHEGRTPLMKAMKDLETDYGKTQIYDTMVKAGCQIDTCDQDGRNLLHLCISGDLKFFQYINKHGLDPKCTDIEGNTLWHAAMMDSWPKPDLYRELVALGVNPEQPNDTGRTPLHVVSSLRPRIFDAQSMEKRKLVQAEWSTSFDDFLTHASIKNLDHADQNGVTALHLASTFSEYITMRLLQAGTDPLKTTNEGLTVFHLAARSQQPNVIGVLIDHLTLKCKADAVCTALNTKDRLGRTALWYACASGHVETVQILIDAGAAIETEYYKGSPWQGCVEFEEEAMNWEYRYHYLGNVYTYLASKPGGVLIEDKLRPDIYQHYHERAVLSHHLDDIVELLATYENGSGNCLHDAISAAADKNLDYTVSCLVRASKSIADRPQKVPLRVRLEDFSALRLEELLAKPKVSASLDRRRIAQEDALKVHWERTLTQSYRMYKLYGDYLQRMLQADGFIFEFDKHGHTVVDRLILRRYGSILAQVLTPEIASKFDDFTWHEEQEMASKAWKWRIKPLLLTACEPDFPNMDVIRLLVEKVGVNINAQTRKEGRAYQTPPSPFVKDEGALHHLIRGFNWWQTAQALPYLIEKGADLELRDHRGLTPLNAALERIGTIVFGFKTVQFLVKLGADVSSEDNEGVSCLIRAISDVEVSRFLVESGAQITHGVMLAAINKQNYEILDLLLSKGGDPNRRDFVGSEMVENPYPRGDKAQRKPGATFLLEHAATIKMGKDMQEKMIELFLACGADVNARYENGTHIMHRVIIYSPAARILLSRPDLDVEQMDAEGLTLLLTACHAHRTKDSNEGDPSYVEVLASRGANVRARDKSGKNALHHLLPDNNRTGVDPQALPAVLKLASELIHQRDNDGNTPLHYAAKAYISNLSTLLSAGADPRAINNKGDTVLHYLVRGEWSVTRARMIDGSRREAFEKLLKLGADINARNHRGETPIFNALRGGYRGATLKIPPPPRSPDAPQYCGVSDREKKRCKDEEVNGKAWQEALLEFFDRAGVDWTSVNEDGETLLHVVAADKGFRVPRQRFEWLIGKGLDVMAEDKTMRTPLDVAAGCGGKEVLGLFERKGEN